MVNFYCLKCKKRQELPEDKVLTVVMKNARKAGKGKCPVCGTTMFKILGKNKES